MSILCLVINLIKAKFTLGSSDEHFYITEGYRLLLGDKLFFDDLFIGQSFSLFVVPFVWLYRLFVGSNEGIVFYMRIVYAFLHFVVGCLFYYRFYREQDSKRVLLATIIYFLFTPFNIMALSYNTLSINFLLLACIIFPIKNEKWIAAFVSGLLYGCAVLNAPLLAFGYFVFLFIFMKSKYYNRKNMIYFSIGIGCIAILFLGFIFTGTSIQNLQKALTLVFDPAHSEGVINTFIKSGGKLIVYYHIGFIGLVLLLLLPIIFRKSDKKEMIRNLLYIIAMITMIWIGFIHPHDSNFGGFMLMLIPYALLGFGMMLFDTQPYLLKLIYFVSIFHSFVVSMSSNVGPKAFSAPLIVACMITTMMIPMKKRKWGFYLSIVFILLLGYFKCFTFYQRSRTFNTLAEDGPCSGLYDAIEVVSDYHVLYRDVEELNTKEGDYIVFVSDESWPYLMVDKKPGTGWTYPIFWEKDGFISSQEAYFELHPNKSSLVYIDMINKYGINEEDLGLKNLTFMEDMRHGILFRR